MREYSGGLRHEANAGHDADAEHDANAGRGAPIGILGGMGVRSTAPFLELVIEECRRVLGASREMDFPPMMIHTVPVPFDADGPIDHRAMRGTILGGLRRLDAAGVRFIAMPCNTAHIYFAELAAAAGVPILDMVEEAIVNMPDEIRRPALVATRPTVRSRLYHEALERTGRRESWSEELQARVDDLLVAVKGGAEGTRLGGLWQKVLKTVDRNADGVLIACTDINAVPLDDDRAGARALPVVDATRALARAVAVRWAASAPSSASIPAADRTPAAKPSPPRKA